MMPCNSIGNQISPSSLRLAGASRIEKHVREGTLVQGKYHARDYKGRDFVCLLSAADPNIHAPYRCPTSLMPRWLAYMIPQLFDGIRPESMNDYALWFAEALRRGRMDDAVLRHVMAETVKYALAMAKSAQPDPVWAYWPNVKATCNAVIAKLLSNTPQSEMNAVRVRALAAEISVAATVSGETKESNVAHAAAHAATHAAAHAASDAGSRSKWAVAGVIRSAIRVSVLTKKSQESIVSASGIAYEHIFDALIYAMLDGDGRV